MSDETRPVAGILFTDGKRLLLLKRASGGSQDTWAFPGGRLDDGESPLEAAIREAKEEIGQAPGKKFASFTHVDGKIEYTTFMFAVDEPFEVELNHEHSKSKWVKLRKVKEYKLFPAISESMEKYIETIEKHFKRSLTFKEWLDWNE